MLLLALFLGYVAAHNWMVSPSRVPFAATVFPCMGKRSVYPHVQVAVGQEFQLEWATGHDRNVYFVLLHKNDSDKLSMHSISSTGSLEKYIAAAPSQLLSYTSSPMLCADCKYHRTPRAPTATHTLGGTVASHYAPGGPNNQGTYYRARPTEFGTARDQYTYVTSPNDRYVSYPSTTYPWIKAVWRYEIQEADPGEWDFAVFRVRSAGVNLGPGDYIMHYLWSGYYDCIDINVIATTVVPGPVPYPYGKPPNGTGLIANRVDHCLFDSPQWYVTLPRPLWGNVEGAASSCIQNCLDSYENGGCGGVSAFPISAISKNWGPHWNAANNILKKFYDAAWDPNAHWTDGLFPSLAREEGFPYDNTGTLDGQGNDIYSGIWRRWEYVPAGSTTYRWTGIHPTTVSKLKTFVETGTGQTDPWVCVYVSPKQPTSTSDKYTLSDDPLDPVFYSTCYEILEQKEFIGFTAAAKNVPEVPVTYIPSTLSGCISCANQLKFQDEDYTPDWKIEAKCQFCQRDNKNPAWKAPYPMKLLEYAGSPSFTPGTGCVLPTSPAWASWTEYCLIPHEWSHPLLADNTADPSTFKWWSTAVDGPTTGYSTLSTRVGWQPTRTSEWTYQSNGYCASMVLRDTRCSPIYEYNSQSESSGCRCVRDDPCCTATMSIGTDQTAGRLHWIVESKKSFTATVDPNLDPYCNRSLTGLRSTTDPKMCCKVPSGNVGNVCGTTGCVSAVGTGSTRVNAMCRGWQIPADRCCSAYAPPCRIC